MGITASAGGRRVREAGHRGYAVLAVLAATAGGCTDPVGAMADGAGPADGAMDGGCDSGPPVDGGIIAAPQYLTVRPSVQGVHVVDLGGESPARTLLARSLQGVVNRTAGRVYLLDDQDAENMSASLAREAEEHWLTEYQSHALLTVSVRERLDDTLRAFGSDFEGYFLVSSSEYWTVNAAVTAGIGRRALIATAETAPALQAMGLPMLDSFVGRWPDATTCYLELAGQVGRYPHPGFAILASPFSRLHDFLLQQGVLTLGGYQAMPEWAGVQRALSRVPPQATIYGYPARDGAEELLSVNQISAAGDVLVASDSTPNVSLHVTVQPTATMRAAVTAPAMDCNQAALNVVIALSDGDNLVVPLMLYPTRSYWLAPQRGTLPIAWSISPALATIAPAAYAYYARTLAPGDELVSMIGPGYAYGGAMPNGDWFYQVAFEQVRSLGLHTLWLFDPVNAGSGRYAWEPAARATHGCDPSVGLLDGYYPPFNHGAPGDETVGGVPLMRARGQYSDGPAQIADRITSLLAMDRADRPRVAFFSAAAWNNDLPTLAAHLLPLQAQGVRYLNPATAMQCVTH